jgi:hypothetical protein
MKIVLVETLKTIACILAVPFVFFIAGTISAGELLMIRFYALLKKPIDRQLTYSIFERS